jgi:hypothetical protein
MWHARVCVSAVSGCDGAAIDPGLSAIMLVGCIFQPVNTSVGHMSNSAWCTAVWVGFSVR